MTQIHTAKTLLFLFTVKSDTKSRYFGVVLGVGWGVERKLLTICIIICKNSWQICSDLAKYIKSGTTKKQKSWSCGARLAPILYILLKHTSRQLKKACFEFFIWVQNFETNRLSRWIDCDLMIFSKNTKNIITLIFSFFCEFQVVLK